MTMKDRARLDWVMSHRFLCHEIQQLAAEGDETCIQMRKHILDHCHLTERQLEHATTYIRNRRPEARIDDA